MSKTKTIKTGLDSILAVKKGIDTVADIVASTLGPKGRNVIIQQQFGPAQIINDGVSVAKSITLSDVFENQGCELLKSVCENTNSKAGDGTTTSAILTKTILEEGTKALSTGCNGQLLKKGINKATEEVINRLKSIAIPVSNDMDKIKQIATISANDENVGNIIVEAIEKVGINNKITLEDSKSGETYIDVVDGFRFDKGYVSPYLATDVNKGETVYENPYIMVLDEKLGLNNIRDLQPILEKVIFQRKPLLISADDYSPDVIETLVVNNTVRRIIEVVAVKSPGFGEHKKNELSDIALFTGAKVITPETGMKLKDITVDMFGTAKKITVTKDETTIVMGNGNKDEIDERCNLLIEKIKEETSDYNKAKLEERLAKLKGKIGVIYVGGSTDTEQKELKLRVEDAVNATAAACEEGIVAGGGSALTYCKSFIDYVLTVNDYTGDVKTGMELVLNALTKPLWYIANNSGLNAELVVANVYEKVRTDNKDYGINAVTGEYCNMIDEGIVDPVKVTITALKNASSIASMVLTSYGCICDEPEKECKCCD